MGSRRVEVRMVVLAPHGQRRPIEHKRRARNRDERRRPRRDRIRSRRTEVMHLHILSSPRVNVHT